MENCIFCKIVRGEVGVEKVFENDAVLSFVPKDPIRKGHILVVPKEHCENVLDISRENLASVMEVARDLAKRSVTDGATGVNLLHAAGKDAQQSVFHFHLHIVPRSPDDGLDLWFKEGIEKINKNKET